MASISTLVDRVKIFVLSSGTGPFELGSNVPAYRGAEALLDGATYSYAVENGSTYEVGTGVYLAAESMLVRSPELSSNGGAAVAFPAGVQLVFTARSADLIPVGGSFPIVDSLGTSPNVAPSQRATTEGIEANETALANLAAVKANASALGVAGNAENMGVDWLGAVPDNVSAKEALQALEASQFNRAINVRDKGAVGGARRFETGAMTSGSVVLTVADGAFITDDVGKLIAVEGAAASNATLYTTISAYTSATQVSLSVAASTTTAAAQTTYGWDDTEAFTEAMAEALARGAPCYAPADNYLFEGTAVNPGVLFFGAGFATKIMKYGEGPIFENAYVVPTKMSYFVGNTPANSQSTTFSNPAHAANFRADTYAIIGCTKAYDSPSLNPQRKAEFVRIKSVVGATVNFYGPVMDDYLTGDAPELIPVTMGEGVGYAHFALRQDTTVPPVPGANSAVELRNFINTRWALCPVIYNVEFAEGIGAAMSFEGCIDDWTCRTPTRDLGSATLSDGTNPNGLGGFGYSKIYRGLNFVGVTEAISAERTRHTVTCGGSWQFTLGRAVGQQVKGGSAWNSKVSGWDTHETGFAWTFENVWSFGALGPHITLRNDSVMVRGGGAIGCLGPIVAFYKGPTENAQNCVVDGIYGKGNNWGTDFLGTDWTVKGAFYNQGDYNTVRNFVVDSCYGFLYEAYAGSINPRLYYGEAQNLNMVGVANKAIQLRAVTATTTSGSPNLTSVAGAALFAGQSISGTGIPPGTTVVSYNSGAGTAVMSANATASNSGVTVADASTFSLRDVDIDVTNGLVTDLVRNDSTSFSNIPRIRNLTPFGSISGLMYSSALANNQFVHWTMAGGAFEGFRENITLTGTSTIDLNGKIGMSFVVARAASEQLALATKRAVEGAVLEIVGGSTGIVVVHNAAGDPDSFFSMTAANITIATGKSVKFKRRGAQWVQGGL